MHLVSLVLFFCFIFQYEEKGHPIILLSETVGPLDVERVPVRTAGVVGVGGGIAELEKSVWKSGSDLTYGCFQK